MRAKHLFGLFAVLEALLLPCAAHAQCSDFYCETFAVYNPGSRAITGYSHYDDYGISWGWWLEVQSYVSDPTGYNNPVGQSWGYDYVEVDFCYTPTMNGGYTAWGYNYYDLEVWWVYDGDSYSPGVYVSGPPGQQITGCPSPSWVLGGNYVAIFGSGFSVITPSLSWSGDGGVDFLNGDSWVQVYSDVEIMVYADLSPLSTQGTLALTAGTAACQMVVPPIQPPPPAFAVTYQAYIPVDHVTGPDVCNYNVNLVNLLYKGDANGGYRAAEGVTLVPDVGISLSPSGSTGQTRNYGFGSPANGQTLSQLDEDGAQYDCYLWNNAGQAPVEWSPTVSYPQAHQAVAALSGTAQNPLVVQFGGIQWNMSVKVDTSQGSPVATIVYQNTCYPAHQVSVNGQVVYSYVPNDDTTAYIVACLAAGFLPGFGVGPGVVGPVAVKGQ